ncbi:MAG: hypothetical protein IIA66_11870 [Planctomycetes bacterium]|nr:hypothetical protein [Planctomycetota bacterium]
MTHYHPKTFLLVIAVVCAASATGCKSKKQEPKENDNQAGELVESKTTATPGPAESKEPEATPKQTETEAAASQTAQESASLRLTVDRLEFVVPRTWVIEQPTSSVRKAQLRLPGGGAGDGDAELVIYNFGTTPEAGGSVEANFVRWCGQFVQADGRDSMEVAARREAQVSGMAVHTIDVSGRYVAAVRPGNPEKHDKPDHRMLGSVIISPEGKYFLKLLGPVATVEKHAARYEEFLRSLKRN